MFRVRGIRKVQTSQDYGEREAGGLSFGSAATRSDPDLEACVYGSATSIQRKAKQLHSRRPTVSVMNKSTVKLKQRTSGGCASGTFWFCSEHAYSPLCTFSFTLWFAERLNLEPQEPSKTLLLSPEEEVSKLATYLCDGTCALHHASYDVSPARFSASLAVLSHTDLFHRGPEPNWPIVILAKISSKA